MTQANRIAELESLLAAAEQSEAALEAKVQALSPHGTCACSIDTPTDKCGHHSPQIQALTADRDKLLAAAKAVLPCAEGECGECTAELREAIAGR